MSRPATAERAEPHTRRLLFESMGVAVVDFRCHAGVEPTGAPTLYESLRANAVVELPEVKTAAGTLAPRKSDALNVAILRETLEEIVLVSDDEMRDAARFLLTEIGIGAELSGAAALAAVLSGRVPLEGAKNPCVLVYGTGSDTLPA